MVRFVCAVRPKFVVTTQVPRFAGTAGLSAEAGRVEWCARTPSSVSDWCEPSVLRL
ncbi:hypothetical protein GCM10010198_39660 [Nocardia seriolae]|nr:hypothetical protein NSERKGN1266_65240 [Nocardia seriolae]BEK98321.1 hypothetical protein NSER024013_62270 [Nocardia seriolae]GEM24100.1 hypothetical protein NS2_23390 [Nocardia seriolae NBRC 15557]